MKIKVSTICIVIIMLMTFGQSVSAEEKETHMVYKVTTYDLGVLLGNQDGMTATVESYAPLLITGSKADILTGNANTTTSLDTTPDPQAAEGFAIGAQYRASSQLSLQGTFGMAKNSWDFDNADKNSSWEANLGLVYRLLDNLSYEIHFGYMETGDLFKERSTLSDVENIIMLSNKLTMSF